MRALVWIIEDTWESTVSAAAVLLPGEAEVTLLHIASTEVEALAGATRHGLLGRRPPPPIASEPLHSISEEAARRLLADAQLRLGRPAKLESRRGRVEREVIGAAASMDVLVLARDGNRKRLGPQSLGPTTRFVVDHAPCQILLIWPDGAPELTTMPPPRRDHDRR